MIQSDVIVYHYNVDDIIFELQITIDIIILSVNKLEILI
jgi:hypothetical protein